jgi:Fe2+ or Zn2+ uptake regulation protein
MITKNKISPKKERLTNQKKVIVDYLRSVKSHPSAETVFNEVKKKLPRISLGTVYRILKNLKKKEEIKEIPTTISCYDGDISPHAHFICQYCDKIFDVFDIHCEDKLFMKKKTKWGKIKSYDLNFYGVCNNCQKTIK